jgi:hypothetical protein
VKKFIPLLVVIVVGAVAVVGAGAILLALHMSGVPLTLDTDRAQIESLLKKHDGSIEELSPVVHKTIGGHPYALAKMKVKSKNAFGMPVTNTMGYVSDLDAGYYFTMNEETFDHFLQTGDKSGFPKLDKPLSVGDVPAAESPTPESKPVIYSVDRQAYYDALDYSNEHPGVNPNSVDVYNYGHRRATAVGFTGADESAYAVAFRQALSRIERARSRNAED